MGIRILADVARIANAHAASPITRTTRDAPPVPAPHRRRATRGVACPRPDVRRDCVGMSSPGRVARVPHPLRRQRVGNRTAGVCHCLQTVSAVELLLDRISHQPLS